MPPELASRAKDQMINFHEIKITGLFGRIDVTLPIRDNRVIIIGHNGIGKSTILNAFYYLISAQWQKLREIDFDSLKVKTDRGVLSIERSHLLGLRPHQQRSFWESYEDISVNRSLSEIASRLTGKERRALSEMRTTTTVLRSIANKYEVPVFVIEELRSMLHRDSAEFKEHFARELQKIADSLVKNLEGRILYLPTYRRIEKDIKSIFPAIEDGAQWQMGSSLFGEPRSQSNLYVELVNFGMQDVHRMIEEKMELLRHLALRETWELSTKYLRDVIHNEGNKYDLARVQNINEDDLRRIFANVNESLLGQQDQRKIYEVVTKIKTDQKIEENEQYVAHYISSLIDISEKMDEREKPVQEFVHITESYLFEKQVRFDNAGYSLQIEHDDGEPAKVELENLSSGEKQIVSLFAHMTLDDDNPKNYVIIDEPELSLSVDWQQRFLQDISKLDSCAFVGAVTHSPFVFENELDKYAVDMHECISR